MSRVEGIAVSGGFRHRAGASSSALNAFPLPAHRTQRADFPHADLVRDHAFAHSKLRFRTLRRSKPIGPPQPLIREPHVLLRGLRSEPDHQQGASRGGADGGRPQEQARVTGGAVGQSGGGDDAGADPAAGVDPARVDTIATDNGREFAGPAGVAVALALDYYFARPYHSWERGLSERTNGLARQDWPKWKEFKHLSPEQVRRVQELLNNRPRTALGYRTPSEAFRAGYGRRRDTAHGRAQARCEGGVRHADRAGVPARPGGGC